MSEMFGKFGIESRFNSEFSQQSGELIEIVFCFDSFSKFCCKVF